MTQKGKLKTETALVGRERVNTGIEHVALRMLDQARIYTLTDFSLENLSGLLLLEQRGVHKFGLTFFVHIETAGMKRCTLAFKFPHEHTKKTIEITASRPTGEKDDTDQIRKIIQERPFLDTNC
jgi:hypothetical protein